MNAYLNGTLAEARGTRDAAVRDFGGMGSDALNWAPAPGRWSIGQCLHHLIVSNEHYWPAFAAIAHGAKRPTLLERIPLLPRVWGPLILRATAPDARMRRKTSKDLEPSASTLSERIVEDFERNVDAHLERIEALRHVDHERVVVTSPVARFVTYTLKDAITISIVHLERHRLQAVRVMEHAEFPRAAA